jgi:archaellum component FlaC
MTLAQAKAMNERFISLNNEIKKLKSEKELLVTDITVKDSNNVMVSSYNNKLYKQVEELKQQKSSSWGLPAFLAWSAIVAILNQYR